MVKSFRALTILLGKLGIAKEKFTNDHDLVFLTTMGLNMPKPRPPWPSGISYGLGIAESHAWVVRYLANKSDPK